MPQAQARIARQRENDDAQRLALARSSLVEFTRAVDALYNVEPFHAQVASILDDVVEGRRKRVMLFAPPQHGKSELVSVKLPAFWLGRRPLEPVIITSYAASLAESKSRKAREIVESDAYRAIFPDIATRRGSRAVDEWELTNGRAGVRAKGVGGGITGFGAGLLIVDDPLEDWASAQSQRIRDNLWAWYQATLRPRLRQDGAIVLIMTRWHEDDIAGRLIAESKRQGEAWDVFRYAALAETQAERDERNALAGLPLGLLDLLARAVGEALAPRRYRADSLRSLASTVGSLAWEAEYMGAPRAIAGTLFKREWVRFISALPVVIRRVRFWDKAATDSGGAYTAGVLVALALDGSVVIEDVIRGQWSPGERDRIMRETARLDAARDTLVEIVVEQEGGSAGVDSMQATAKLLAGFNVRFDKPSGSKVVRAMPLSAQFEAGNVSLLRGSWVSAFVDELLAFPNGRYKDQIDAASGGYARLVAASLTSGESPLDGYRG